MADQIMAKGLEGIVVAETGLSAIDGERGVLMYRGYNIHDLAEHATYPEALYLLWNGDLPDRSELETFERRLVDERPVDDRVIEILRQLPAEAAPMAALRTAVSSLASYDDEADDMSEESNRRKAARLAAKFPTVVAAFHRLREGEEPVAPRDDLGHAANFLWMLHGEEPSETETDALDTSLLLYLDHGFNASTFTCRVIASTLSDMYSAITGGISALKGALHGGANEKAMRMLLEIGAVENTVPWLEAALERGEKIMGFGHRVYRTEDPRATHLREMSERLSREAGKEKWFEISRALEQEMLDRKGINCNVDYYCGSVYYALDLPLDLYTALFAMGRIGGWTAHVMEQLADNRLIRPRAEYAGPSEREWVPLERR